MGKNINNRNRKDINKYKYYKKQNELIEKNNEEGIISNNNKFINKNNTYNVYKENNLKSNAGITIITLAVTILIIIILASITINAVLGDNGLIKQAQDVKDMAESTTLETGEKMNKVLQEYENIMAEDGEIPIKTGIEAADISENPTLYYGAEVIGYTCTGSGVEKWRIFYADESNIYLIADDCIDAEYIPDGKEGTPITVSNEYGTSYIVHFEAVINDYPEGANWIKENSLAKEWLSQFLNNKNYNTSINNNIKAVAYLMDTNVWSCYAGNHAEYAIGGPTIELFCASYKDTHPSQYVEYSVTNSYGYSLKWNNEEEYNTSIEDGIDMIYNGIYTAISRNSADVKWIASPSAKNTNNLLGARWGRLLFR